MLAFNFVGFLVVYALQRLQASCRSTRRASARSRPTRRSTPPSASPRNTNWQGYGGETTMSYLTQMLGLDRAELRLGGGRHGGRWSR